VPNETKLRDLLSLRESLGRDLDTDDSDDSEWPASEGRPSRSDRPFGGRMGFRSDLLGGANGSSGRGEAREGKSIAGGGGIWPLMIWDDESTGPKPRRRSRLSLNTKAFLIMGGTGLASAFVVSPLILLFDGVTLQAYILLSCLMALASFVAGLANYHVVLTGVHGLVRKVDERTALLTGSGPDNGGQPLNHGAIDTVDTLVGQLVERARSDMETLLRVEQDSLLSAITALAAALEARDPYTRTHSRNVAHFSAKLAAKLGLDDARVDEVHLAGQLHDIGKIGIKDEILLKPGSLTRDEFGEIKKHPDLSVNILRPFRHLDNVRATIRHHHEKMDGSGYPDGLKGEEIPLPARIMAVVDVFDAMTSDRPYRPALTFDEALEEMKRMSGAELDPNCVNAFLEMANEDPELLEIRAVGVLR
jgi:putative nucleotidyltransferase with HDIG domain